MLCKFNVCFCSRNGILVNGGEGNSKQTRTQLFLNIFEVWSISSYTLRACAGTLATILNSWMHVCAKQIHRVVFKKCQMSDCQNHLKVTDYWDCRNMASSKNRIFFSLVRNRIVMKSTLITTSYIWLSKMICFENHSPLWNFYHCKTGFWGLYTPNQNMFLVN